MSNPSFVARHGLDDERRREDWQFCHSLYGRPEQGTADCVWRRYEGMARPIRFRSNDHAMKTGLVPAQRQFEKAAFHEQPSKSVARPENNDGRLNLGND